MGGYGGGGESYLRSRGKSVGAHNPPSVNILCHHAVEQLEMDGVRGGGDSGTNIGIWGILEDFFVKFLYTQISIRDFV